MVITSRKKAAVTNGLAYPTCAAGGVEPDDVVAGLVEPIFFVQRFQDVPGRRGHQSELVRRLCDVAFGVGVVFDVRRLFAFDVGVGGEVDVLVDVDAQVVESVLTVREGAGSVSSPLKLNF